MTCQSCQTRFGGTLRMTETPARSPWSPKVGAVIMNLSQPDEAATRLRLQHPSCSMTASAAERDATALSSMARVPDLRNSVPSTTGTQTLRVAVCCWRRGVSRAHRGAADAHPAEAGAVHRCGHALWSAGGPHRRRDVPQWGDPDIDGRGAHCQDRHPVLSEAAMSVTPCISAFQRWSILK